MQNGLHENPAATISAARLQLGWWPISLRHASGARRSYETISGVHLYYGVPDSQCGHLQSEQSYFDRLWDYRQGEETERFYMAMRRAPS